MFVIEKKDNQGNVYVRDTTDNVVECWQEDVLRKTVKDNGLEDMFFSLSTRSIFTKDTSVFIWEGTGKFSKTVGADVYLYFPYDSNCQGRMSDSFYPLSKYKELAYNGYNVYMLPKTFYKKRKTIMNNLVGKFDYWSYDFPTDIAKLKLLTGTDLSDFVGLNLWQATNEDIEKVRINPNDFFVAVLVLDVIPRDSTRNNGSESSKDARICFEEIRSSVPRLYDTIKGDFVSYLTNRIKELGYEDILDIEILDKSITYRVAIKLKRDFILQHTIKL